MAATSAYQTPSGRAGTAASPAGASPVTRTSPAVVRKYASPCSPAPTAANR
ncbi:Uncharacterised protein [Mycobacteroides abscessus]|nr:Uncharacterised protein [Mycobacteroides abscessus]